MAGIRTSAVWVIGTATLSTPVGQTSLGNYIFAGLQTQNWVFVLFGCVAAAVLALVVDQLLALMESGVGRGKRARVTLGGIGLLLVVGAALAPSLRAAARDLHHRREDLHRAISARRADRAAPERRGSDREPARGARLHDRVQRARRRRYRRLCRLFRHDLGEPDGPHRRAGTREGAGGGCAAG